MHIEKFRLKCFKEFIKQKTTQNNGEPLAFVSNEMGNEMSDNYGIQEDFVHHGLIKV